MIAALPCARNKDARPAIEPVPSPSGRRWLVSKTPRALRSTSHARANASSSVGDDTGACSMIRFSSLMGPRLGCWEGGGRSGVLVRDAERSEADLGPRLGCWEGGGRSGVLVRDAERS